MSKYLFFALLFAQLGFSQELLLSEQQRYWKFHNWAALGYRYDRQHFNQFIGNSHSLNTRLSIFGRSSPFLTVGNHTEFKNILLILRGTYGWMVYGRVDYDLPNNYGREPLSFNTFKDDAGYSAEGKASLSYIFNVRRAESNFAFAIIPGIGYGYSHLMDYPCGIKTDPISNGTPPLSAGTSGFATAYFSHAIQQDWYGPYIEARILMRFMKNTQFEFFYQYQIPDLRMVIIQNINTYLYNPSTTLTQVDLQHSHNVVHGHALRTQLGGFDARYHGAKALTFGLHFEGSSTWSHTNRYNVKQTNEQLSPTQSRSLLSTTSRMAIHWVTYMTYAYLGYRF